MSMSDNIADMLTRIRNGQKGNFIKVDLPYSKLKCSILSVLEEEGYIDSYQINFEKKEITIFLRYSKIGNPAIMEIHRVSKPGKRIYSAIKKLPGYFNHMGIYILSTSKGIMSDKKARHVGVGGEIICKIF